jgi:hypothetical protein
MKVRSSFFLLSRVIAHTVFLATFNCNLFTSPLPGPIVGDHGSRTLLQQSISHDDIKFSQVLSRNIPRRIEPSILPSLVFLYYVLFYSETPQEVLHRVNLRGLFE